MLNSTITLRGDVELIITKNSGKQEKIKANNLIVNGGKNLIAHAIAYGYPTTGLDHYDNNVYGKPTMIKIGNGTNPVDLLANSDLTGLSIEESTSFTINNTVNNPIIACTAGFPSTAMAIKEAGIFNDAGTMLARVSFDVINITFDDSISINWTITVL